MQENSSIQYPIYTQLNKRYLLAMLYFLAPFMAIAQEKTEDEEVAVYFNMQRVGNTEMIALIRNDTAYLPITEIFDFLKIVNKPSAGRDSISGFFINQTATYLIDYPRQRIIYKDKTFTLKPGDLIKTPTSLYLKASYFGEIFNMPSVFSYRNLSVTMNTDLELPVLREMRLAEMRNNINQLKGAVKVDTTIKRSYPLFRFGTADWSVINTEDKQLGSNTRAGLRLGGIIASGETEVSLNYNSTEPLRERNQYYRWRLANNDNTLLRQVIAGKIMPQSISSIFAPVVGVQVTNTPTTFRRSFGTYTISNTTKPNWVVELYINNVLVSYVKADASGFYSFEVPLIYGSSVVRLKFYGPAGEETFTEQNISVPFNFLPANEFEYSASAGFVQDSLNSRFSRLSANYGFTGFLTAGIGAEYLSTVSSGSTIPFINTSARLLPNLLLSAEHAYGVRTKALLTYKFASGLQIELNNTWYKRGQTAINNTFTEERKAILSVPIRGKSFSAYTRLTINQMILPITRYTTAEWLVSGAAWNINGNINTFGLFSEQYAANIFSNISLSTRLFKNLLFTQQVQYAYRNSRVIGFKEELERRVFNNGYLKLSYENNLQSSIRNFEIGLRYDFQFAQTGTSYRTGNNSGNFLQFANGSLMADGKAKYLDFNNRTSVGSGGVKLIPFLDFNFNGKRDKGEPKAKGLKIKNNSAGIYQQNVKDTTLQITQLEPYVNYILTLDASGFENISWQLSKQNYSIAVDPNIIKIVEIPVQIMAEVTGNVSIRNEESQQGLGRIIVRIYHKDKAIAQTITESDGYFSYLGLRPGDYRALIDTLQLKRLKLNAKPAFINFSSKMDIDGGITDGLQFILTSDSLVNPGPSSKTLPPPPVPSAIPVKVPVKEPVKTPVNASVKDRASIAPEAPIKLSVEPYDVEPYDKIDEIIRADQNHRMYGITVQVAHFKIDKANSSRVFLISKFNYDAFIKRAGGYYYNVYVTGLKDLQAAKQVLKKIKHKGFPDAYILARKYPEKDKPK